MAVGVGLGVGVVLRVGVAMDMDVGVAVALGVAVVVGGTVPVVRNFGAGVVVGGSVLLGVGVGVAPVGVTVGVGVGGSMHGLGAATLRHPSRLSQESMVQTAPSSQSSIWQNGEQPSQLLVDPTAPSSQVSGNSVTPFPHVGHGIKQFT